MDVSLKLLSCNLTHLLTAQETPLRLLSIVTLRSGLLFWRSPRSLHSQLAEQDSHGPAISGSAF